MSLRLHLCLYANFPGVYKSFVYDLSPTIRFTGIRKSFESEFGEIRLHWPN